MFFKPITHKAVYDNAGCLRGSHEVNNLLNQHGPTDVTIQDVITCPLPIWDRVYFICRVWLNLEEATDLYAHFLKAEFPGWDFVRCLGIAESKMARFNPYSPDKEEQALTVVRYVRFFMPYQDGIAMGVLNAYVKKYETLHPEGESNQASKTPSKPETKLVLKKA